MKPMPAKAFSFQDGLVRIRFRGPELSESALSVIIIEENNGFPVKITLQI
jgi:hypothetical protein